jgi:hypothetical protein
MRYLDGRLNVSDFIKNETVPNISKIKIRTWASWCLPQAVFCFVAGA